MPKPRLTNRRLTLDLLSGVFVLTIYLSGPDVPEWQQKHETEFSTYSDCMKAAMLVNANIESGTITCSRKDTRQVLGTYKR